MVWYVFVIEAIVFAAILTVCAKIAGTTHSGRALELPLALWLVFALIPAALVGLLISLMR